VKRYEGLFILNSTGTEEGIKESIDTILAEITAADGKVETVQKMDKKPFMRVANKKFTSGFYVNIIFESEPSAIAALHSKLTVKEDIFRALFTSAPLPKAVA